PGLLELALEVARLDRDQYRFLLVAVDDAGDSPRAPGRAGGPLSGPLPPFGGHALNFGHLCLLFRPFRPVPASRGAGTDPWLAIGVRSSRCDRFRPSRTGSKPSVLH